MTELARAPAGSRLAEELRSVLPSGCVAVGESVRTTHGEDLSFHPPCLPEVVVLARSTRHVADLLAFAHEHRVPVVPFGAGSSLEGHVLPVAGGISLDLRGLDSIVAVKPSELTATVQAGVTRKEFERRLAESGLCLPVDPGADATLGGMAATNAGGTLSLLHGKMRSRVLSLEAVLPGGRVVRLGSRTTKTSAGYDLLGLLIGSEGTLGVITELTLRLEAIPESVMAVRASFPGCEEAAQAARALVAAQVGARRLEFIDEWDIAALNRFRPGGPLAERPLLMVEVAGSTSSASARLVEATQLLREHQGSHVVQAMTPPQCQAMWRLRSEVFDAERQVLPGRRSVSTDACVPLGQLGDALRVTRSLLTRFSLVGGIVAHAGDGNIHTGLLVDPQDQDEMSRLDRYLHELVADTLRRGGTCTGEHGIGMGKREALRAEHGDSVDLMWEIKRAFDPHLIMNPGKVLPDLPPDPQGATSRTSTGTRPGPRR